MDLRLVRIVCIVALCTLGALPALAEEGGEETRLQEHLAKTSISLTVDGQTIAEVLQVLRVQTGLNLLMDPRIAMDIAEVPVTGLHVNDLPLETVLHMVAAASGESAVWFYRGNVAILTHREFIPRDLEMRIVPIGALTMARTEFIPPSDGLVGGGTIPKDPWRHHPYGGADELIELIKNAVEPTYWEETEGADVRTMGEGRLVMRVSPRIHAAVDRFLASLEDLTPDAVQVEVYAIAAKAVSKGMQVGPLDDDDARALLAANRSGPALTLAVRKKMQSVAFSGGREAYVKGHEAHVHGTTAILDPEVANLEVGMAARVRALPSADGNRLLLELDVAVSEATSRREHQDTSGDGLTLPNRRIVRRNGALLLTPGRWHWAEGRSGGDDPARWGFLVRATPVEAVASAQSRRSFAIPTPAPVAGHRQLRDRRIANLSWEDASLDQVATYLRTVTGLNIYITPRVREEVYEDVAITLELGESSVATVLDLVTEPYELMWKLEGNLITIEQRSAPIDNMEIRYFDVKDLTVPLMPAHVDAASDYPWPERPAPGAPIYAQEALVDLIRESIGGEAAWEDPAAIEARNHILIARNTPRVLDTIDRFFHGLRASLEMVVTTVDQIEMDDATWRDLWGGRSQAPFLDADLVAVLDRAVEAGTITRLSRERIVSIEGSGTPRSSGEEIPYVADYDIDYGTSSGTAAAVRRVETLHSGTRTNARSTLGYPGGRVTMELTLERTLLTSMGKAATPHGDIDLPNLDVWSVSTGCRIPLGQAALVSARRSGGTWRLLLATPRRVPLDDE